MSLQSISTEWGELSKEFSALEVSESERVIFMPLTTIALNFSEIFPPKSGCKQ